MKWVTRERPKIDRIACPWLIARFIDNAPEFLFVPMEQVFAVAEREGAILYDIPGAELSHVGELCSFDTILSRYELTDPTLHQLAVIVALPTPTASILLRKLPACSPFRWVCPTSSLTTTRC
jgi:hypothetical protein